MKKEIGIIDLTKDITLTQYQISLIAKLKYAIDSEDIFMAQIIGTRLKNDGINLEFIYQQ